MRSLLMSKKVFFHVSSDYIFYFLKNNSIQTIAGTCMFGFAIATNATTCEPIFDSLGYANLVKTSRLLIYNSTIVEMVLISWN